MKRYLYYLRKYVENFGFVNRVVWLVIKNKLLVFFLNDRKLMKYILNLEKPSKKVYTPIKDKEFLKRNFNKINSLLLILPFSRTCLINSLVYSDYMKRLGFNSKITFGVNFQNDRLVAHCWNYLYKDSFTSFYKKVN